MSAGTQMKDWFTRHGRGLGAGALVLAALAVGRVVEQRLPEPDAVGTAPIEKRTEIGDPVDLRVGTVTVTKVTGGKSWTSISEAKLTTGVWIVADVELLPSRLKSGINDVRIRDDQGHTWFMGRGESTCTGVIAGVPMTCQVIVEVPEQPISGAELVLRWNPADDRWDDQAVIPLDLGEAKIKEYAAVTEPIKIPMPTLGDS